MRAFAILISAILGAGAAGAAESKLVYAKDGSGIFGYKHTPIQSWSGYHVHDPDRPAPVKVTPARVPGGPPSDAMVLFDGRGLDQWQPSPWKVADGILETTEGNLVSRRQFGDCQIHVEWQTPEPQGDIMNRGNNGVLLMGLIEIQIFDSFNTRIYPDGQAAAVYGQTPPLVDAALAPEKWQTYDIVFLAPRFKEGRLDRPARVTLFHNGLLAHHNQEVHGAVAHATLPKAYPAGVSTGPLILGGHHSPVRFRNIWVRPIAGNNAR